MSNIHEAIETLADALMTIPADYPADLRRATYKKSLEGLVRLVRSEEIVNSQPLKTWIALNDDLDRVEQIRKAAQNP